MVSEETAKVIAEGFRTYYNFLRPHSALNNKTPAKEADIDLELRKNKWLSLIRRSIRKTPPRGKSISTRKNFKKLYKG